MTQYRIVVLAGDGVGPEVTAQATRVLQTVADHFGWQVELVPHLVGAAAWRATGSPLPAAALDAALDSDAVLLGAVGDPSMDSAPREARPEAGLLALRKKLGAFANLRPVRVRPSLATASPLRPEILHGVDVLIVRELTGGLYYGEPRGRYGSRAVNTLTYDASEIERVARVAFEAAKSRGGLVTSVDKANVLEVSQLWRETVTRTAKEFPTVRLDHQLVDTMAMKLIASPSAFDVVLTENMFGDILSDEAAVLAGSLGLLPSASLGEGPGVFEPVHGSAPDIAGKGIANPIGAILSVAMLFRFGLKQPQAAEIIERAVDEVAERGYRTADIARHGERPLSTAEMGDRIHALISAAQGALAQH
jgi:3-isopropylmalate dehydrogenase